MSMLTKYLSWSLAAVALYLFWVAVVVTGGVLLGRFMARNDPMDDAQARVFAGFRPAPGQRLMGHCVEILIAAFDLVLRVLWLLRVLPAPRDPGSGTPIVLLPGYSENAGCMWWIARRLSKRGFRPFLIDFPSTFHGIEHNVAFLRARVAQLCTHTGAERVAIVAHSMGGIVARSLLLTDPEPPVLTLIALSSPFRGTHLARLGAALGLGASPSDMCPNSAFCGRYLPSASAQVPIRSIIGEQENIVAPPWSIVLPGCETYLLSTPVGHDAPLLLRESYARIEAWLLTDGVLRSAASRTAAPARAAAVSGETPLGAVSEAVPQQALHDLQQDKRSDRG